ncbi:hypothetical protein [Pseudomonas sp. NMI1173_11]|uniref:hypothetical protein n=1 Tax=Pseudomonas sp. NMI1173_11 TaxID=2903145 RepID=UPI001E46C198|nr:hypothetical protein [Pseudomonas sp. NMI1173_11]MCE0999964.1 hypothetical protein [Pseudomonas sp. NMI1173_11]
MALGESEKIAWPDILDAPFIYDAWRYVAGVYQVAQPLSRVWVDFVVIRSHAAPRRGGVIVE